MSERMTTTCGENNPFTSEYKENGPLHVDEVESTSLYQGSEIVISPGHPPVLCHNLRNGVAQVDLVQETGPSNPPRKKIITNILFP